MIHLHDRSLSWLGTGTALKGDVVKICYRPQSPPISENDTDMQVNILCERRKTG